MYLWKTFAAISTWASLGTISGGISTRFTILMPLSTMALYFMSLMLMKL